MISRDFCRDQIARLYQFKGYPRLNQNGDNEREVTAAFKELIDALQCAPTEEKAREVIDFFAQSQESRDCPLPPEIRRAVFAPKVGNLDEWTGWTEADIGELCQSCHSWGYRREEENFVRCECPNGQELPQGLLDSMNKPPVRREKDFRPFGGDDFDATVRRAIVARMSQ